MIDPIIIERLFLGEGDTPIYASAAFTISRHPPAGTPECNHHCRANWRIGEVVE
jgi:hypothetical protein